MYCVADVSNIDYVINYDAPQNSVAYIHRIGRTGRGGRKGTSITFLTEVLQNLFANLRVFEILLRTNREIVLLTAPGQYSPFV